MTVFSAMVLPFALGSAYWAESLRGPRRDVASAAATCLHAEIPLYCLTPGSVCGPACHDAGTSVASITPACRMAWSLPDAAPARLAVPTGTAMAIRLKTAAAPSTRRIEVHPSGRPRFIGGT